MASFRGSGGRWGKHTGTTIREGSLTRLFLDYRMMTALDVPMVETVIVEVPNPNHPYGAKAASEAQISPPGSALANAICDAVGVRMDALPMNPEAVSRGFGNGVGVIEVPVISELPRFMYRGDTFSSIVKVIGSPMQLRFQGALTTRGAARGHRAASYRSPYEAVRG